MKKKNTKNYLDYKPQRVKDAWRIKEDGCVEIDIENKGIFNFIAQKFFKKPRISHIALDPYGSEVWKNMDGDTDVYAIVKRMEKVFPDEKDGMINRVVTFVSTLHKNGFVRMKMDK